MTLPVLPLIADLIEQPPPEVTLAALRTNLKSNLAAVQKAYSLLSNWDGMDADQAHSILNDIANRRAFYDYVVDTVFSLSPDNLPMPLADEAKKLLADASEFEALCYRAGKLCLSRTRPLTIGSYKSLGFPPISRLPDMLAVLNDAIDQQNQIDRILDEAIKGTRVLSDYELAATDVDVQANLEASDFLRSTVRKWLATSPTPDQQNQLQAAMGLIEVLISSVYNVQLLCARLKSRTHQLSVPPPLPN
jgi:hypothetical protein